MISNQTHGTWSHGYSARYTTDYSESNTRNLVTLRWRMSTRDVLVSVFFYYAVHSFFIAKFTSSSPLSYSLSAVLYFLSSLKMTE